MDENNKDGGTWDNGISRPQDSRVPSQQSNEGNAGDSMAGQSNTNSVRVDAEGRAAIVWAATWAHEFILNCFDPEVDEDAWRRHASTAHSLIQEADMLLARLGISRETIPSSTGGKISNTLEETTLRQDLCAFSCVAAGFMGDIGGFKAGLAAVCDATKSNVLYSSEHPGEVRVSMRESGTCFGYIGASPRLWTELLVYVARSAPRFGLEAEVAESYKGYITYLSEALRQGFPVLSYFAGAKSELERLEGRRWEGPGSEWPPF